MKKEHVLIPLPKSSFLLVRCPKCGTERVVYSHSTTRITCSKCGELLVVPTGGKAKILGEVVRRLD
jgi:small subunit ribosomal protein S27e